MRFTDSWQGKIITMGELVFLKIGGSLITDKTAQYSARLPKLLSLAEEIRSARLQDPEMRLVLGHGSGSFGHFAVTDHLKDRVWKATAKNNAVDNAAYWAGFAEVWYRASELNRLVLESLHSAGVPCIAVAPSAGLVAEAGKIISWDTSPIKRALDAGIVPVIFGDIVFDKTSGGKVLSTEVLMRYLLPALLPDRILLAGIEDAVWADYPIRRKPMDRITPKSLLEVSHAVTVSDAPDVTGGMRAKVEDALAFTRERPGVTVRIFSGEKSGSVLAALQGEALGTLVTSDENPGRA